MDRFGDEEIVRWQLGRKITNMSKVVHRCPHGYPVVIESLPVKNGKPFPTLYWLTCPHLKKKVSELEAKGFIEKFERELRGELFEKMKKAHQEVVRRRLELVPDDFPYREDLERVGTGGIRDYRHIKCLHLHVADFLAGVENPVGEMVLGMIEQWYCGESFCRREVRPNEDNRESERDETLL